MKKTDWNNRDSVVRDSYFIENEAAGIIHTTRRRSFLNDVGDSNPNISLKNRQKEEELKGSFLKGSFVVEKK